MSAPSESTVLRRLLAGSAMSLVNMVVGAAIGLVMTPFLLRNVGDRQMGMYVVVGSFTGFYGLLDFGITSSVSRYLTLGFTRNDVKACNSFASIGFYVFLAVGAVAAVISLVVASIIYLVYDKSVDDIGVMSWVVVILGINFMIDFPLRVFNGIVTGCLRHDLNNVRMFVFRILGTTLTFAIVYHGGKIIEMSLGSFVMSILSAISFYWLAKKVFPPLALSPKSIRREDFKPLFSYGIFMSLAQIADTMRTRMNGVVIAGFHSVDVVAHYGIAATLTDYFLNVILVCTNWMTNWFTRLSASDRDEAIVNHLLFVTKVVIYISNFIAFGLVFWSVPFIARWVGPKFLDAYDSVLFITLGMMVGYWQTPGICVLQALVKHRYHTMTVAFESVIGLTMTLLTVPSYGMTGAAFSYFCSRAFVRFLVYPSIVSRVVGIPLARYWRSVAFAVSRTVFCLVAPLFITNALVSPEYKWLFINGAICACVYAISIYFTGFRSEERKILREKLRINRRRENTKT